MKIYRTAVVGCGALAQAMHLPNISQNPRTKLVAACDVSRDTAVSCKETFDAERFETDWHKVVEADDIDVIVLATHTNLRGELIVPALKAGKPVYTEKPLSIDRQEMVDIVRTSRETGVPVCVGHNRRSSPAMLEFKRLLSKAESSCPPAASVDRRAGRMPIPEESRCRFLCA
jgi:predicted dehydrogenase